MHYCGDLRPGTRRVATARSDVHVTLRFFFLIWEADTVGAGWGPTPGASRRLAVGLIGLGRQTLFELINELERVSISPLCIRTTHSGSRISGSGHAHQL